MIVPASTLPTIQSPAVDAAGDNDNGVAPNQQNLLMAAAQMHKLGRLGHSRPPSHAKLKAL